MATISAASVGRPKASSSATRNWRASVIRCNRASPGHGSPLPSLRRSATRSREKRAAKEENAPAALSRPRPQAAQVERQWSWLSTVRLTPRPRRRCLSPAQVSLRAQAHRPERCSRRQVKERAPRLDYDRVGGNANDISLAATAGLPGRSTSKKSRASDTNGR